MYSKYVFSGHESFPCKMLWLAKGYAFMRDGHNFSQPDAVIHLGVGKNMVASIRYWLRVFGMAEGDNPTPLADFLFGEQGADPYTESLGTLWLLHYHIVSRCEASLYNIVFTRFQRERKSFDRDQLTAYVGRLMAEDGKEKLFNSNTIKKDIAVLLQNYVQPVRPKSFEDYSSLLMDLNLIRTDELGKGYAFNIEGKQSVPLEIFLYAILKQKGDDLAVSFDTMQEVGLTFCMTDLEVIAMAQKLGEQYSGQMEYSDNAGIRQLLFKVRMNASDILKSYYGSTNV